MSKGLLSTLEECMDFIKFQASLMDNAENEGIYTAVYRNLEKLNKLTKGE